MIQQAVEAGDYFNNQPGRTVALTRATNLFAVRYRPNARSDDLSLSPRTRSFLVDATEHLGFVPRYGLQLYQTSMQDEDEVRRRVRKLDEETPVCCASPVFRWSPSALDIVLVNNRFLVEFHPDVGDAQARQEIARLNATFGVEIVEQLGYTAPAVGYHLRAPAGQGERGPVELAKHYHATGLFRYAIPELIQRRVFRSVGLTERAVRAGWRYQEQQWHLRAAQVVQAWQQAGTLGRPDIVVGISDDGVDVDHPEFASKVVAQHDFDADVADARPKASTDHHGTACAGVAVAAGVALRGAAPGCGLIAARFPERMGVADEARMFQWMADSGADVISCSWGPPDGTGAHYPLPGNVASAIRYCVKRGRGGRGIPVFWAAGNGNESIDSDGYASNPDVIAIAACTDAETKAHYSDFGRSIALCAPSSGTRRRGHRYVFTTDRRGAEGYNPKDPNLGDANGDYTNDFGGTSSAAPLVAGVAALMLSVDDELDVEQIRDILLRTADPIGSGYGPDGHSDSFGHGRVNALAAIRAVQAGSGAPPVRPAVQGPDRHSRAGDPPSFELRLPRGTFGGVELASDLGLFDAARRAADRTSGNYFASWSRGGLRRGGWYRLPTEAWQQLRNASVLYYRLVTSSSGTAWTDVRALPGLGALGSAPHLDLSPTVRGPSAHERSAPPPRFDVRLAPGEWYGLEVGTQPSLFADIEERPARTADNFFASWQEGVLLQSRTFALPATAWARLRAAPRLYYRLLVSSSGAQWSSTVSVPARGAGTAWPEIELLGSR